LRKWAVVPLCYLKEVLRLIKEIEILELIKFILLLIGYFLMKSY